MNEQEMEGYVREPVTLWQIDNGFACGGVMTDEDGIVFDGCPYFLKFLEGKHLAVWRKRNWRVIKVSAVP